MSDSSSCRLGSSLTLRMPGGAPVITRDPQLELTSSSGRPQAVTLTVKVDRDVYDWIDRQHSLGLTPEVRGPIFGGRLPSRGEVELEIGLSTPLVQALPDTVVDMFDVASFLLNQGEDPGSPYVSTARWFIFRVKQASPDVPGVKVGFQTSWFGIDSLP